MCNDDRLIRLVDDLRAERARLGLKALALAPTLDLYHALVRGEEVPLEKLVPEAVVRFGLRRRGAA